MNNNKEVQNMNNNNGVENMKKFETLLEELNEVKVKEYVAVDGKTNPVAKAMGEASQEQLTYIIQQYCIFPKEIITYLKAAKAKAFEAGWEEVAIELQRNIGEELGSDTNGICHFALLVRGLKEGLGMPVYTKLSAASCKFVESMKYIFSLEASYTLGATYALEATGVPELEIISQLVNLLFEGAVPKDLQYFLDMHIGKWEVGHEEGLRTTAAKYLDAIDCREFSAGFRAVMESMDAWWNGLAEEALLGVQLCTI